MITIFVGYARSGAAHTISFLYMHSNESLFIVFVIINVIFSREKTSIRRRMQVDNYLTDKYRARESIVAKTGKKVRKRTKGVASSVARSGL